MKKLLDYQRNPVLFVLTYYCIQVPKIFRCIFDKNYHPKYRMW
jgi:hypothetical protein